MTRRHWLLTLLMTGVWARPGAAQSPAAPAKGAPLKAQGAVEPLRLTDAQWKKRLTPEQYHVLREDGTERPGSSPLNDEKRKGRYLCVGCDHPLFSSEAKFDSGTGWPSFHTALAGAFTTRTDYKIIYPRTEYRCARCDGHHGHVFDDGPKPTGKRYCNNGVVLKFQEA